MSLRVLVAPDKFKGTLSAQQAAGAIVDGWWAARPQDEMEMLPMSDGGDGFGGIVAGLMGATEQVTATVDAAARPVGAKWWWHEASRTAVIEAAQVVGLAMLPPNRFHPFELDTRGLGAVIRTAVAAGAQSVVIGIGGSATNDGGAGMARALGYRFLDRAGLDLPEGGAALRHLHHLEGQTDPRLIRPAIEVACDVRNPLLGPEGASAIYGPQKGATPAMIEELDAALETFADVIEAFVGRNVRDVPGAGAAGGLGAGLVAFLDAQLRSGAELVLDATKFASRIKGADLVVTGEGRADAQSVYGKLTQAVTHAARDAGVRAAMIVGGTAPGYEALLQQGIEAIEVSTPDGMPLADAMRNAEPLIEEAAARLAERLKSH